MNVNEAQNALAHATNVAEAQTENCYWLRNDPRTARRIDWTALDTAAATVASIVHEHGPDFAAGDSLSASAVAQQLAGVAAYVAEFRPKSRRAS